MAEAFRFPAPDYELMESLIQNLLERLRAVNVMIADGADGQSILAALKDTSATHERLMQAMQMDALNVHAAGHIFAVLLGDRVSALRNIARAM